MLEYIAESNPYFDISKDPSDENKQRQMENDFCYTDTDAIQVHSKNHIPESRELGGIANDLGDDCKIISGIWIAPKLYMLEFIKEGSNEPITVKEQKGIDEKGDLIRVENGIKLYYHLRGKGVPKGFFHKDGQYERQLDYEAFKNMSKGKTHKTNRSFAISKINTVKNSKQEDLPYFSLFTKDSKETERTLNRTIWNGREFIGNYSTPLK